MAYPNLKQSVWLMVLLFVAMNALGLVLSFPRRRVGQCDSDLRLPGIDCKSARHWSDRAICATSIPSAVVRSPAFQ